MKKVKIKICGLTREEDVKAAITCGADAVGFVFAKSSRRVSPERAICLGRDVPRNVLRVGLFMNQHRSDIEKVIKSVPLDVLQFHGDETERDCGVYGLPWLKAVAMENVDSARQAEQNHPGAMGLLLDSHSPGQGGGSGKVFDWSLSRPLSKPVWLAGGLNANNVAEAIRIVKPYAVDISSGVESAPGIKDANKIAAFTKAVRKVESEYSNGDEQ